MLFKNIHMNEEKIYDISFTLSNLFLIFSIIIFFIYLIAPLLGGELFVSALIHYGSWILLSIGICVVSQRGRKGLEIRLREWLFLCLVSIINFIIWFKYTINIILVILIIIFIINSYIAHKKTFS